MKVVDLLNLSKDLWLGIERAPTKNAFAFRKQLKCTISLPCLDLKHYNLKCIYLAINVQCLPRINFLPKRWGIFAKSLCSHITNSTDKQTKIILKPLKLPFGEFYEHHLLQLRTA